MSFEGCQWGVIGPFYRSDHISLRLLFFPHNARMSLDTRRIFSLGMWLIHQPSASTEGHINSDTKKKHLENRCRAGKWHHLQLWSPELQALLFCEISPWMMEIHNNGARFWQQQSPFHTPPDRGKSVDLNDVQSSLSRRAGGSPGQKSTDSSKCC